MKRKIALLLVAMLLLSLFTGCGATTTTTTTDKTTTPADDTSVGDTTSADVVDEPANTTADEPADEPVDNVTDEPAEAVQTTTEQFDADENTELPKGFAEGTIGYPICDPGEITIEYWRSASDQVLQKAGEPFADNWAWNRIEEVTGIHVDFNLFSSANYSTQLSLMFASEDYPDAANIIGFSYSGGWSQAIEDEVIVDLAPYVETYAPNYMRWVNLSVGNRKNAYTDEGQMPTFGMVYNRAQNAFYGYTIRQDWLDELGLEMPDTIEEWDDILHAFKDQKTNGAPLWI